VPDLTPDPDRTQRILVAAAVGLALMIAWSLAFGQPLPAGTTLDPREAVARSQRAIGTTVGDHALVAADGRAIRLSDFRGKPLIVSFVYTGCFAVCPTTTKFLADAVASARRAMGEDAFRVLTIGFNLPFDSPSAMRDFARKQGIDDARWTFASPSPGDVEALASEFGFQWVPTAGGFDHLAQATIVDANGRVFRQVYGDRFELPMLVMPLRELALGTPAPADDLRSIVERVRLLCTVYDARAGRYRLDYALFFELFTGLTFAVATIGWLIVASRRRVPRLPAPR
jgi:protein SCO1/2